MRHALFFLVGSLGFVSALASSVGAAVKYAIDSDHTSIAFKIKHAGISWVHGRFNLPRGELNLTEDVTKSTFNLTIPVDSLDTRVKMRDEHLLSPDFFDVRKHPEIVFQSTQVRKTDEGLEVTGNLAIHGQTRTVVLTLAGGETAEFPPGGHRIGYTTNVILKRSDFGMTTMLGPIGDDVHIEVSLEAIKQ